MTTKYDIGQRKWFLVTKGKFGPVLDSIDEIYVRKEGVQYRIGGHLRAESELFDSVKQMVDLIEEEAAKEGSEPF